MLGLPGENIRYFTKDTPPANPSIDQLALYADAITGKLTVIDSTGANAFAPGGLPLLPADDSIIIQNRAGNAIEGTTPQGNIYWQGFDSLGALQGLAGFEDGTGEFLIIGNPILATSPPLDDNSERIATTAFVWAALGYLNVTAFGAIGDMRSVADGHTSSGSHTLTSATANFTQADVGKPIIVSYAGGAMLFNANTTTVPTITAVASATSCTVSAAASDNTSSGIIQIGTDNSAAFAAAFAALFALPQGTLSIPAGNYLCLSPWGTLSGLSSENQYAIVGAAPLVNNGLGGQNMGAGVTNIVLSPYITYNNSGPTLRFLTVEFSGVLQDLCFTNWGCKNSYVSALGSGLALYYITNTSGATIRCSWDCILPTGVGNGCLQIASDNWRSYGGQITSTCGGLEMHGLVEPMEDMFISAAEYGVSLGDASGNNYRGCKIIVSNGPAVNLDGSSGGALNNKFTDCVLWGGGTTTKAAITGLNAGTAPFNSFVNCYINSDHISTTLLAQNLTTVALAKGNTLSFTSCVFGAFGSGYVFDNAGTISVSSSFFPTQAAWTASITYLSGFYPSVILDPNGHLQYVSAITTGISGGTIPAVWSMSGGTTADGGVTWTDAGVAATIEHNTGSGSIIDGGGNIGL